MMRRRVTALWRENGLSIVLLGLFLATLAGQYVAGRSAFNAERLERGESPVGWIAYSGEGHFISATFENWESEFLQMGLYVLLTVFLRQRGSAESRPFPGDDAPQRIEPGPVPVPIVQGGWMRTLYENSLTLSLLGLFVFAFAMHGWGSWSRHVGEELAEGRVPPDLVDHLGSARFWFESLQNWQSEFLAVLALVVLSIFLRQKDSPQSKAVGAPHRQTGH
jgi:hypothetical protein